MAHPMRPYAIAELLGMRTDLPMVSCILSKLNKHPDIAGIMRIPVAALEESNRASCKSQSLVDIITRDRDRSLRGRKEFNSSSSDYAGTLRSMHSNSMRGARHLQWQLRRRESSDSSLQTQAQPISAPSDLAKQQSENFQRFYRAVVSPTHVRVTAGGRIVPNTRVAPPVFDPAPGDLFDKATNDNRMNPSMTWEQTSSLHGTGLRAAPAIYKQPLQENKLPPAMMTPHISTSDGDIQDISRGDPSKVNREATVARLPNAGILANPIKISDPSQFDQSKPFMYNGHVVYPMPSGFQPPPMGPQLPFNVIGNPNFMPHPGGFLQPVAAPMPMVSPMMHQIILPPAHLHPSYHPQEPIPSMATYMPAIPTMLSVTDLTKQQIGTYRAHLKHIENQIANNQHQIDKDYMTSQRNEVVSAIEKMESMLDAQLAHEAAAHKPVDQMEERPLSIPKKETSQDSNTPSPPLFAKPRSVRVHISEPSSKPGTAADKEGTLNLGTSKLPWTNSEVTKETNTQKFDIRAVEETPKMMQPTKSEPATKSRLLAAAAKAPAFQPRSKTEAVSKAEIDSPFTTYATVNSSTYPQSLGTNWPYHNTAMPTGDTLYGTIPKTYNMYEGSYIHAQPQGYVTDFQRAQTFHGLPAALSVHSAAPTPSVPYLCGTLPKGMRPDEATPGDFTYPRPLTEEEIHARHMYWGKTPRSVFSGLPKFDGRDFYPPSPQKIAPTRVVSSPLSPVSQDRSTTPKPVDLENLFMDSPKSGARITAPIRPSRSPTRSPVRMRPSIQNIIDTPLRGEAEYPELTPSRAFLENGIIGFASPSPRPSTYRYDSRNMNDWPGSGAEAATDQKASHHDFSSDQIGDTVRSSQPTDDFSHLFLERGEPGYKSPTPSRFSTGRSRLIGDEPVDEPVTPTKRITSISTLGSRGRAELGSPFGFSPKTTQSSMVTNGTNYFERASSSSNMDTHKLLQGMHFKHSAGTVSAPALSSATAHGYLPHYGGLAATSLAHPLHSNSGDVAPLVASNFLPENRPLNRDRLGRPIRPSVDSLGAEGYMRYLAAKSAADMKIIAQGWDSETTATGPVAPGQEW